MGTKEIMALIGAVLGESHFVYKAGGHGPGYVAKDVAYTFPLVYAQLAQAMANDIADLGVEVVCGIEVGAVALGEMVAYFRAQKDETIRAVYVEKEREVIADPEGKSRNAFVETGKMIFKRGYGSLVKGKRVLIVEDITTTGSSILAVVNAVIAAGGIVVGVVLICNRGDVSPEKAGVTELRALMTVKMENYPAAGCPLCAEGVPINTEFGHGREFVAKYGQPKSKS